MGSVCEPGSSKMSWCRNLCYREDEFHAGRGPQMSTPEALESSATVGRLCVLARCWAPKACPAPLGNLQDRSPTVQVSKCLCGGSEQGPNAAGSLTRTAPATPETIYCGTQSIVSPSVFAASGLRKDKQCASRSVATKLLCSLKQTCVPRTRQLQLIS